MKVVAFYCLIDIILKENKKKITVVQQKLDNTQGKANLLTENITMKIENAKNNENIRK